MTGRKKLPRETADVALSVNANGSLFVSVAIFLEKYNLPANAKVYLEAYYRNSYMRFSCGVVADISSTRRMRFELTDIQSMFVHFRIKIVDETEAVGLLLAQADKIQPLLPEEAQKSRTSLLGVHFNDIGERIWELELSEGDSLPHLDVNNFNEAYSIREYVGHNIGFIGLVYPEVLEKVLRYIYQEDRPDSEDPQEWQNLWLTFVKGIPGVGPLPDLDSQAHPPADWYSNVREQFSKKLELKSRFANEVLAENET